VTLAWDKPARGSVHYYGITESPTFEWTFTTCGSADGHDDSCPRLETLAARNAGAVVSAPPFV